MKNHFLIALLALSAFASGCSTLTGDGTSQNLSVMTYTTDNKDLTGASCELKNDEGTWTAVTPASVMVRRSNKDLMVKESLQNSVVQDRGMIKSRHETDYLCR